MHVTIKTPEEQQKMRVAGRLAAEVLDMIGEHVVPGVTTDELDRICHRYIVDVQATPPPNLNYRGFPKTICTSVNDVVCHGIPNDKRLKAGDIVNIDVTVIRDGYHGDTSRMYFVGKAPPHAQRLAETCFAAMWRGIDTVRPGAHLGDIGHAIQTFVEQNDYSVVREYCGHGIGRVYHEDPQVLHYGEPGPGLGSAPRLAFPSGANGQCRQASRAAAARWLDRNYERPLVVGAVGAHRARHRDRRRCTHARGERQTPGQPRTVHPRRAALRRRAALTAPDPPLGAADTEVLHHALPPPPPPAAS